jgi:hypothetical protein
MKENNFAIVTPEHSDLNIIALKSFLERYGFKVFLLSHNQCSLDKIVESKINNVIIFDDIDHLLAVNFITAASVRKIFNSTTFYYLSKQFLPMEEQVKLMTLGYIGFLRFPFSAFEVQNTIDLCASSTKIA